MKYKNVVITSVPYTDTDWPIMAPAILKSIVDKQGIQCRAFDLNHIIYKIVVGHPRQDAILDFFMYGIIKEEVIDDLNGLFELMVQETMKTNPDLVCLSLMHFQCKKAGVWLSFWIKKLYPNVEILVGGPGINDDINSQTVEYFGELQQHGIIDHFIYGDGELALEQFLQGNISYPGINNTNKIVIEDLDALPYPNYDDYGLQNFDMPYLSVVGSRGCVRQCTFCDVHETWKKFNWRSGDSIFAEIMYQHKKYGIRHFKFQDNLINGNIKEYTRLTELLSEYNKNNPDKSISWVSFFIFRPKTSMSEKHWQLTAESGANILQVGIESLTETGRFHMKKKFTNEDIEFSLQMAKKYKIKIMFLLMVGYVTETEEEHQAALQWMRDNARYAGNPIIKVQPGGTLAILPNTWLHRHQDELGITWNTDSKALDQKIGQNHLWEIKSTGNNYPTRIRRHRELIAVCKEHGFTVGYTHTDPVKSLENSFTELIQEQKTRNYDIKSYLSLQD